VIAFADASAIVKLYVDEAGHEVVRALSTMAISQVSRVEVVAAFWRKHRIGELDAEGARVLAREFEADYYGTADDEPRFVVVGTTGGVLDAAAGLCSRFPLRADAAVQLASAVAVRDVDPGMGTMAVFDASLRDAALAEGLAVVPVSPGARPGGR